MSYPSTAIVEELRNWTRYARERGTDVAVIFHPQREQLLVDVHHESLTGVGLYLEDAEGFDVGQEVEIIYDNEFFRACVRNVEPRQHREFVVGFECADGSGLVARWKKAASVPPRIE